MSSEGALRPFYAQMLEKYDFTPHFLSTALLILFLCGFYWEVYYTFYTSKHKTIEIQGFDMKQAPKLAFWDLICRFGDAGFEFESCMSPRRDLHEVERRPALLGFHPFQVGVVPPGGLSHPRERHDARGRLAQALQLMRPVVERGLR